MFLIFILKVLKGSAARALENDLKRHHKKMLSSTVYHLALVLFSGLTHSLEVQQKASEELEELVQRQYPQWVRFRKATKLPPDFTATTEEEFLLHAKSDLTCHLVGDKTKAARKLFKYEYETKIKKLSEGCDVEGKIFSLREYWNTISLDCPAIAVVVRVLQRCSASEAAIERFFSLEAIIHSKIRNSLAFETIENMMMVKQNYESLTGSVEEPNPFVFEIDEESP